MMNFCCLSKHLFVFILLGIFITFFAIPSFMKYKAAEVIVNKKIVKDIKKIPAVTICPMNRITSLGWNISNSEMKVSGLEYRQDILNQSCKNYHSVKKCVDDSTYDLPEYLLNATENPLGDPKFILDKFYWIEEVSLFQNGKCIMMNTSLMNSSTWLFLLNQSFSYKIYLHDPHFFVMNVNPSALANIKILMDHQFGLKMIYINAIHHTKIDNEQNPCNPEPDYSFTSCVKESVTQLAGCRYVIT